MLANYQDENENFDVLWVHSIPDKLEEILGVDGTDQFVTFLNSTLTKFRGNMLTHASDRFEGRLKEDHLSLKNELALWKNELKEEFADFRKEVNESNYQFRFSMRAELDRFKETMRIEFNLFKEAVRTEIHAFKDEIRSNLNDHRFETKIEMNQIRLDISSFKTEVKGDIADLHKTIAIQTRWILAGMLGIGSFLLAVAKMF
ncbi:DUF1640 domain-containing protein [Leptospira yasudae]|uniref:LA_3696 family protein n=1 Tax=Leptospira yasudae TaxID=2202201 RepID=UPI00108387AF|nr:DUF1640 domain-containing protein [Leptospira yasudae]TGK23145.1 DUF1640 domain-containing protein [Leptospira yasudae]TGM00399.1 DUF1640 domain-containing protein [Leptospira yasudae]